MGTPKKRVTAAPPLFGPCIVAKRLDGSRCHVVQTTEVGLRTHCVRSTRPKKGDSSPPILGRCLLWSNGWWIKMPLGRELDLGTGDIVLDGDPALPPERGIAAPLFLADVCCGQTVANLCFCWALVFLPRLVHLITFSYFAVHRRTLYYLLLLIKQSFPQYLYAVYITLLLSCSGSIQNFLQLIVWTIRLT